jgi:putative SbcD/Mre11-related phosphoesterase
MISIIDEFYIAEDLPVVYFRPLNLIIFSDVHIGYEEEMSSKGIFIPRVQKKRLLKIYERAIEVFKTNKVLINGDLKHSFHKLTRQEKSELTEIFQSFKENGTEVIVVKGNHDNYISLVSEKFDNIQLVDELRYDKYVFTHGHKMVNESDKIIVIGHEHPRLNIKDRLGFARKLQCFLKVPLKNSSQVLILPAIGTYQAGNDISLIHTNYMSPIIKELGVLEKAKPFVIFEGQGIMEFPELGLLKDLLL